MLPVHKVHTPCWPPHLFFKYSCQHKISFLLWPFYTYTKYNVGLVFFFSSEVIFPRLFLLVWDFSNWDSCLLFWSITFKVLKSGWFLNVVKLQHWSFTFITWYIHEVIYNTLLFWHFCFTLSCVILKIILSGFIFIWLS